MFRIDHPYSATATYWRNPSNRTPIDQRANESRRGARCEKDYFASGRTTLGIENITSTRRFSTPTLFLFEKECLRDTRLIGLATAALAGGRPGEVSDGDDEEAVAGVGDTGKGVVPGSESGQETEQTTCLLNLGVGHVAGATLEVTNAEQQEGQVQEEEEQEECDGRFEGAEEHDGGEDEPSLDCELAAALKVLLFPRGRGKR